MNSLVILSAIYGLAGAFYVVAAKLRLHLMIRSGRDTIRLGQSVTRIDRESNEIFIDILGFLLIGFSFSIAVISAFTDYANPWGFTVALAANLAAILAIIRVGWILLATYNDGTPTRVPLNAPGKSLPVCLIVAYVSILVSVVLGFFNLPADWVAFAAFFGIPFSVQYLLFPLLLSPHLIQGERARAPPWKWFAASFLCIVLGFVLYLLLPGAIMTRAIVACGFWFIGSVLWFFATIMISF